MTSKLRLIPAAAAACVIAACGGGDAGAPPGVQAPATPTSGVAVDGYLRGATALCDANGNGSADAGEASTTTGISGGYTFASGCSAVVVVTGGTNADTGLPFRGLLKAPAGATVASPLTTLIAAGMSQAALLSTLGLPAGTDLLNTDPALRGNGSLVHADLLKKTLAVQQLLQQTTDVFAGLAGSSDAAALQQVYGEVAAAFGVLLQGSGALNSGNRIDSTMVASLVQAAATRVGTATAVPAAVRNAVAALNAASLGVVTAGSLALQAEALLQAADADVVAVATARQADTTTASFVAANSGQLGAAPTAATATLGSSLTQQVAAGGTPGGGGAPVIDFSGASVGLTAFGSNGGGFAAIAADPADAGNPVAQIVKKPGDEVWAGATVYADAAAGSITPVALTATNRTISVRVYAPAAGEQVLLKLEQGDGGAADLEVQATTTVANAWQTLSFSFPSAGTYRKLSLFPHFGSTVSADAAFYFDDIRYPTAATPPAPADYLALAGDALSLVNGSSVTSYTLAQFQSDAGIRVAWPLPATMLLRVAVAETGNVPLAAGQTLSAAVAISETSASGQGQLLGFIDQVSVSKTAQGLLIAVPASGAQALVYGVSTDASKKAVIDFAASVAGVQNSLRTAAGSLNNIVFGSVVNHAINQVSNDFTGIYGLRGKYRLTIVVNGLPLRQADGSALPELSITVPTALNAAGVATARKTVSGPGLVGFITLTD
ncbi:MAG: hypothetical protein V4795_03325 [Pseudomonadota bacterium]